MKPVILSLLASLAACAAPHPVAPKPELPTREIRADIVESLPGSDLRFKVVFRIHDDWRPEKPDPNGIMVVLDALASHETAIAVLIQQAKPGETAGAIAFGWEAVMMGAFGTLFEVSEVTPPEAASEGDARFTALGSHGKMPMTAVARVHIVTTDGKDAWIKAFATGSTRFSPEAQKELEFILKTFRFSPVE